MVTLPSALAVDDVNFSKPTPQDKGVRFQSQNTLFVQVSSGERDDFI